MSTQNRIVNFYTSLTVRTRALVIWAPLCLAASFAVSQNIGIVNGGTVLALVAFGATGYKAVTGLID
jgi:hypothetical protein